MTHHRLWYLLWLVGLGLVSAALAGCVLQMMSGNITVENIGTQQDADGNVVNVTRATQCEAVDFLETCYFSIDGQVVSSTVYLLQEGYITLNLDDPLILQVPDNIISVTGTYDAGSGPLPLSIGRASSFPVEPGHRITAEVNTTFLFLDVPNTVSHNLPAGDPNAGPTFSFNLSFHQLWPISATVPALTVKPLQAGAVTVLWQTYYIPLYPCIKFTDADPFAAIPAITIPQAGSPQNLATTLGDLIRHGAVSPCHFAVYDFSLATPPPGLLFLPLARR